MKATERDLLEVARDAGLTILLDGRIGRQEYTSVSGPARALEKFAHALRDDPPRACRRVRAARSPSINPLVPARMRERIAAVLYGMRASSASTGKVTTRRNQARRAATRISGFRRV
jgi:hypothetical protein